MGTLYVIFINGENYYVDIDRLDVDLENASNAEIKEAVEQAMGWIHGTLYDHVFDRYDMTIHPYNTSLYSKAIYG